jgi:predicted RNase H-like HicB family nuclease
MLFMDMFSFTGIIIQEDQGFSSLCPELDVASVGSTLAEAKAMLLEAATLHIEGAIEDGLPYLRPVFAADDPRQTAPSSIVEIFRFKVNVAVRAYA